MQVVQTAGLPPNHGRMRLLTSGCTWNSRNALRKIVNANRIKASSFSSRSPRRDLMETGRGNYDKQPAG